MKIRNIFSSFHFLLHLAVALAIALFGYLIFREFHYRFDFSKDKVYSLSPQSIKILREYQRQPIHVLAFFRDGERSKERLKVLLKEYASYDSGFKFDFYDPDRMPGLAKRYHVDAYETVVVEARGKQERMRSVNEQSLTNMLARLLLDEKKKVVFTTGHGGPNPADEKGREGYGELKKLLLEFNYDVQETVLLRGGIPEGTDLLVIAGPRVDLLPEELKIAENHFNRGGDVFFLIDPVDPGEGENLRKFLLNYGIQLGNNVIVDKLSKLFGADYLIPLITKYTEHDITKGFELATVFPIIRSVSKAEKVPGSYHISEVAWTGEGSWGETDLVKLENGTADFDSGADRLGPLSVMAALTKVKGRGRIIVIGDSDFINNTHLSLVGNKDLFLNVVAWLVGEERLISIRPRAREATLLFLKEVDQEFLFYVPVLGLPVLCFVTGTGVFLMRRKYY